MAKNLANLDQFNAVASARPETVEVPDDASIATAKMGIAFEGKEGELKEISVMFEMTPKTADGSKSFCLSHAKILTHMKTVADGDLEILNNKGQVVKTDPIEWASVVTHMKNFKTHVKNAGGNRKSKLMIIHRIRTNLPLSTFRNYGPIFSLLREHGIFMKHHAWVESTWDVAQAGYLLQVNPQYYTAEQASSILHKKVIAANPRNKLPAIKMIYSSPRIMVNGKNASTKAYAIEFERDQSKEVVRILKETFKTNSTHLLLAKMRYDSPAAFLQAIKLQNQYLASIYTIPMLNIPQASLFYLEPTLKAQNGIIDIVDTKRTPFNGRYNILVQKSLFPAIQRWCTGNFDQLFDTVPADARGHPDSFPGIPRVATRGHPDDDSEGSQSFLAQSAASFLSFDLSGNSNTEDSVTLPTAMSWASKAAPPATKPPVIPNEVRFTATTESPTSSEFSSLAEVVAHFEHRQKVADDAHQASIAELTKQIANLVQALTAIVPSPAISPKVSTPPSSTTVSRHSVEEQDAPMQLLTGQMSKVMTPSSNKRRDIKASPQKQLFSKQDFCSG